MKINYSVKTPKPRDWFRVDPLRYPAYKDMRFRLIRFNSGGFAIHSPDKYGYQSSFPKECCIKLTESELDSYKIWTPG